MSDITQSFRFQRILVEAAQYRTLYELYKSDPNVGPGTATLLRDCFRADRDDARALRREITEDKTRRQSARQLERERSRGKVPAARESA